MRHILLCLGILFSLKTYAPTVQYTQEDLAVYDKVMQLMESVCEEPMQVRVVTAAKAMLGIPYIAGTLDKQSENAKKNEWNEQLIVSLAGTDCILLVEACVSMALTASQEDRSFEAFCRNLQLLRYRAGVIDGYASRLHYTSEWILQAEECGIVSEISCKQGGKPFYQQVSFMTTHAQKYPALAANVEEVEQMVLVEQNIEERLKRSGSCYISKEQMDDRMDWLRAGDIVCFVTNVKGLDISHVAFAWPHTEQEQVPDASVSGFLHASMAERKVVIDKQTIKEYVFDRTSCPGIRVVRVR